MPVLLEKRAPVSIAKKTATFEDFTINLNWTQKKKSGLFGMFSSNEEVDLDLGCFVESKNGQKECLQPLGNKFGSKRFWPFVQHSGDDRSGANSSGETLTVAGKHWDEIKRVLVYAYIYEGAAKWEATDAKVTVNVPGHDEVLMEMGQQRNGNKTCALVMLTNNNGKIEVSKEVEFFTSQQPMDRAYNFGFNWKAGRK